jgi:hypothetical protein
VGAIARFEQAFLALREQRPLTRLSQLGRRMSDFRVFCVEKASQYNER